MAMEYLKHCVVPEGEAVELVSQDLGFYAWLGICGGGTDSSFAYLLSEELKGILIVLQRGEFILLDASV